MVKTQFHAYILNFWEVLFGGSCFHPVWIPREVGTHLRVGAHHIYAKLKLVAAKEDLKWDPWLTVSHGLHGAFSGALNAAPDDPDLSISWAIVITPIWKQIWKIYPAHILCMNCCCNISWQENTLPPIWPGGGRMQTGLTQWVINSAKKNCF